MVIVLEKLSGALAGSVGLVSETIAAYRRQEENDTVSRVQNVETSAPTMETDEEQWELDQIGHDLCRVLVIARHGGGPDGDFNDDESNGKQKTIRSPSR
ncbi:hypothetical protein K504DRAFT_508610 [Pleomassaria siparia CBS 279.74]|uniref:Uncharacterized protein n=1 Tax=Pleomassaria siparia CBS 279.74 TaxID=1314801 RepID=A0A6G1JQ99_9PLEO|nr:hypothetical protein K504DRAFT_508610 [Pleomassaria siparia CBS 279.74]